ncbi:MAG: hypothetical protein AAF927_05045 [Bacteroidota bacterium]
MKIIYLSLLLGLTAYSPNAKSERSPQGETQTIHLLKINTGCYIWDIEWIQIEVEEANIQLQYRNDVKLKEEFFAPALNESVKADWIQKMLVGIPLEINSDRLQVQPMTAISTIELSPKAWEAINSLPNLGQNHIASGINTTWVQIEGNQLIISNKNPSLNFDLLKKQLLSK